MTPRDDAARPAPSAALRPRVEPDRTLLGLPLRDALLVLVVALTIATTIVAFAATTLGATDRRAPAMGHTAVSPVADELLVDGASPDSPPTDLWRPHP